MERKVKPARSLLCDCLFVIFREFGSNAFQSEPGKSEVPRFIQRDILQSFRKRRVRGVFAHFAEQRRGAPLAQHEGGENNRPGVPHVRGIVSSPVARPVVIDPLYVSQRIFVKIGLWLPALQEIRAHTVARPHAAFVVSALVHHDRGKHLLHGSCSWISKVWIIAFAKTGGPEFSKLARRAHQYAIAVFCLSS